MADKKPTSGRKEDQKMKAYLVMQYLINNTDESHLVTGTEIADKMDELFGIDAERRSIYRDIHAINKAAGPSSYGMTDTMGRMHSDAQFAGSSSVPAHVEMMGLIGAGNNPMVGMTVACAVAIEESQK